MSKYDYGNFFPMGWGVYLVSDKTERGTVDAKKVIGGNFYGSADEAKKAIEALESAR